MHRGPIEFKKNALDGGKILKSFILTTTFFYCAFMFEIEKIYYF